MKYVNTTKIKLLVMLIVLFSPSIKANEINLDVEIFQEVDIDKMKEILPHRPNEESLRNDIFSDSDKDGVDDFIENLTSDNTKNIKHIVQSLQEYLRFIKKSHDFCKLKNDKKCFEFTYLSMNYLYKCSNFKKTNALIYFKKRLRLSEGFSNSLKYYKSIKKKYKKSNLDQYLKKIDESKACLKIK